MLRVKEKTTTEMEGLSEERFGSEWRTRHGGSGERDIGEWRMRHGGLENETWGVETGGENGSEAGPVTKRLRTSIDATLTLRLQG